MARKETKKGAKEEMYKENELEILLPNYIKGRDDIIYIQSQKKEIEDVRIEKNRNIRIMD
jgi:hypothetical protein